MKKRRTSYYPIYVILGVVVLLFRRPQIVSDFQGFYMSLFNWNMATGKKLFIGFTNFANMFSNPTFTAAMLRTIYMGFEILLITVPLALLIANAINKNFGKKKSHYSDRAVHPIYSSHGTYGYNLEVAFQY